MDVKELNYAYEHYKTVGDALGIRICEECLRLTEDNIKLLQERARDYEGLSKMQKQ